jgi:hypothetical protein
LPPQLPRNGDRGVVAAVHQNQRVEDLAVVRLEADAAMRGRLAEVPRIGGAVDGVALKEENRPRQRRVMVFARPPEGRDPLCLVLARWRCVADSPVETGKTSTS